MVISAFTTTYQCNIMDYPLEAVVRCSMDLCDDIYINDGGSTDGTLDLLYSLRNEYGSDRIRLYETKWPHDRNFWALPKNYLLDLIPKDNYILCLDADDLIHEKDFDAIRDFVKGMGNSAMSFRFIHFYGRPTHYIEGSVWYKFQTRIWKSSSGIRYINRPRGCADDLVWPDGRLAHIQGCGVSNIYMYHYGNCRDPKALGMKARRADDLYQSSEKYKDGTFPKPLSFDYAFDKTPLKLFNGSHPKYIKDWYESHKNQPTTYINNPEEPVDKLWCFKE
jgi:glycosyltransferase involved in cell wall biosynthesis